MRKLAAVVAITAIGACSSSARSCGFEDPNSVGAARGLLNWAFPNALYVTSAVWQAQLDGQIPNVERPAAVAALTGYPRTAKQLGQIAERLSSVTQNGQTPDFSVVLLGPMLWTIFTSGAAGYSARVHAPGPELGDVVIVTDAPVIEALLRGSLTVRAAEDIGVIRLYGETGDIEVVRSLLDRTLSAGGTPSPETVQVAGPR